MNNNLNLARKWRPKTFKNIVGQEIPVRMLQNSLYLNKLFPVYLFAGQRGCGKTSTARIFAAALNCENLENFRNNPSTNQVPCMECKSCKSMQKSSHPDFIEIDAASHTGVENVRQILEACAYMPILGKKKIYLIDEAHMLSKAAFNAFLKILEEPPSSALFILATTEIQKFPETVLSRCFQVIFKAVQNESLKKHLKNICLDEKIEVNNEALDILVQETEGSVRDAINLLEQVRFSQSKITTNSLLKILGKISEQELLDIFEILLDQNSGKLLEKLDSMSFNQINPQSLWNMFVQLIRSLLWIKFETTKLPTYFNNVDRLKILAERTSINRLNAIFQLFWSQETIFLKTPQKSLFLETLLLQICQQINIVDLKDLIKTIKTTNNGLSSIEQSRPEPLNQTKAVHTKTQSVEKKIVNNNPIKTTPTPTVEKNPNLGSTNEPWSSFIAMLSKSDNPFINSILSQSEFLKFDEKEGYVEIKLKNNNSFVVDTIRENKNSWLPLLQKHFSNASELKFSTIKSTKVNQPPAKEKSKEIKNPPVRENNGVKTVKTQFHSSNQRGFQKKTPNLKLLDVSDKNKWPTANLLIKHFPGKIKVRN